MPSAAGRTHASSVIAVVRSSELASATVTQSLTPSNDRPPPYRPVVRAAPEIVPALPRPDVSVAVVPLASSKPQAPTSPVDGGFGYGERHGHGDRRAGRAPARDRTLPV